MQSLAAMTESRDQMNLALNEIVIPSLREMGFKGSFPHFHRSSGNHVDLLKFQFRLSGGSFVVEMSFADSERKNVYIDKDVSTSKLRVDQTTIRFRLGASSPGADHWFDFEKTGFFSRKPNYSGIAQQVVSLVHSQGEEWWRAHQTGGSQVAPLK
jgi:hypothetical protein